MEDDQQCSSRRSSQSKLTDPLIEKYFKERPTYPICELDSDNFKWIEKVVEFFEILQLIELERKSAVKIEAFFCNLKKAKLRKKFNKMIFKLRGYRNSGEMIPS